MQYLRRMGKADNDHYVNCMDDFYIDARCGSAPRKQLGELAHELKDLNKCRL